MPSGSILLGSTDLGGLGDGSRAGDDTEGVEIFLHSDGTWIWNRLVYSRIL